MYKSIGVVVTQCASISLDCKYCNALAPRNISCGINTSRFRRIPRHKFEFPDHKKKLESGYRTNYKNSPHLEIIPYARLGKVRYLMNYDCEVV